jgi:hypothetical protein
VQVDPIKPTLKAPGTKRLKLNYDELLSNFAFKFNLRRYDVGGAQVPAAAHDPRAAAQGGLLRTSMAGAYSPPLSGST